MSNQKGKEQGGEVEIVEGVEREVGRIYRRGRRK